MVLVQNVLYWFKIFGTSSKYFVLVQNIWYQFKIFCSGSKDLYWFKKFCTGSDSGFSNFSLLIAVSFRVYYSFTV